MTKKKYIDVKDLKFTTQNRKSKKENQSFFLDTILYFPEDLETCYPRTISVGKNS